MPVMPVPVPVWWWSRRLWRMPGAAMATPLHSTQPYPNPTLCSGRQYEYLLPTFVLEPVRPPMTVARYSPVGNAVKMAMRTTGICPGGVQPHIPVPASASGGGAAATAADGDVAMAAAAAAAPADPPTAVALSVAPQAALAAYAARIAQAAAADPYCNGAALATGEQQMRAARAAAAAADGAAWAAITAAAGAIAAAPAIAAGAAASAPALVPSPVVPDAFQTGAAFAAADAALWAHRSTAQHIRRTEGYRLPDYLWERLNTCVKAYNGTKAYHNFTPRMTFGDASTVRFMSDVRVSRPFLVGGAKGTSSTSIGGAGAAGAATSDASSSSSSSSSSASSSAGAGGGGVDGHGMEYVRFTLDGQSFLYNQIRHMVGLAADVTRGAAPPNMMDVAFSHGVVKLPLAPAEGLYLAHCKFVAYDRKWSTPPLRPLTFLSPEANARSQRFKEEVLWPTMHASIVGGDKPFHKYIADLNDDPMK